MNIHVDQLPQCKVSVRVEVPAETVRAEREKITQMFASRGKVPGFRPGKAPRKIVERKFQRDINERLEETLMNQGYKEAVKTKDIEVLMIEGVDKAEFHPDDTMTFSATLVTVPDFELPEYKGIKVNAPQIAVTEEDVESMIDHIRGENADYNEVTDRAAREGDLVEISYQGSIDGQPLDQLHPDLPKRLLGGDKEWFKIEEDAILPGLTQALVGNRAGDSGECQVKFPEDHPVEAIRGLEVDYRVELSRVDEMTLPELTDEFVAETCGERFRCDSVEGLRKTLREQLETRQQEQRQEIIADQIVRWLDHQVQIDLPAHLLFSETQRRVNDIASRAMESGMQAEQLSQHEDDIIDRASQQARVNVKTQFVADKIATAEKIEASNDEIGQELVMAGMRQGKNPQQVLKDAQKNPNMTRGIADSIRIRKTISFLAGEAEVTELTQEQIAAERAAAEAANKAQLESAGQTEDAEPDQERPDSNDDPARS